MFLNATVEDEEVAKIVGAAPDGSTPIYTGRESGAFRGDFALVIVDLIRSDPAIWQTRNVDRTAIATLFPGGTRAGVLRHQPPRHQPP